jgi:hypothetical protein
MDRDTYVAVNGNDTWSGTLSEPNAAGTDGPVATLARAIELARGKSGARRIVVRGGAYYDVGVQLDGQDSGLTIEAAAGETPILYGGRQVTGWQPDGEFWSVDLPEVATGDWDFRLLIVNDEMRPRARYPETGALTHENVFDVRWMTSTGGGWERPPTDEELTTLKYKEGDLGAWLDVNNAEVTVYHAWDDSMIGVTAIDPETRTVKFASPAGHPPGGFGSWLEHANTYVVWNIREGMLSPGQWYLDRTRGKLVYWPKPGETPDGITAIAPTQMRIFDITGSVDAPVTGLTLRDLSLSATTTPLVSAGFGASDLDGAITGMGPLVDCQFVDLTLRNVAGYAIKIRDGVRTRSAIDAPRARPSPNKNIQIVGCTANMLGAGAIHLIAQDSAITDNSVAHVGIMYPAAIALWFTGDRVDVSHNEVTDASYDAVAGHHGKGSRVAYNRFTDIMQVLQDGAAIYVFYVEDLVMRGNVTRSVKEGGMNRAHAYYLDEFSQNCDVAENLAVGVKWPCHNHMAQNSRIWGNVFVTYGDANLTFTRSSDLSFEKNVVYATGNISFRPINAITGFHHNVLFAGGGEVTGLDEPIYKPGGPITGLKLNPDAPTPEPYALTSNEATLLTDPGFVDLEGGCFAFKPDSPAYQWGILPIDEKMAGPRERQKR